jgi:hypothetical protein
MIGAATSASGNFTQLATPNFPTVSALNIFLRCQGAETASASIGSTAS